MQFAWEMNPWQPRNVSHYAKPKPVSEVCPKSRIEQFEPTMKMRKDDMRTANFEVLNRQHSVLFLRRWTLEVGRWTFAFHLY
jgi:hypothetical protein